MTGGDHLTGSKIDLDIKSYPIFANVFGRNGENKMEKNERRIGWIWDLGLDGGEFAQSGRAPSIKSM